MDSQTGDDSSSEFERSASAPLRVIVSNPPGHLLRITLRGELDMLTAGQLRTALERVREGMHVLVDLDGLTFLGSSGLQAIVEADRSATQAGATLTLVVGSGNRMITRVLTITGLDKALRIAHDPHDPQAGSKNP